MIQCVPTSLSSVRVEDLRLETAHHLSKPKPSYLKCERITGGKAKDVSDSATGSNLVGVKKAYTNRTKIYEGGIGAKLCVAASDCKCTRSETLLVLRYTKNEGIDQKCVVGNSTQYSSQYRCAIDPGNYSHLGCRRRN